MKTLLDIIQLADGYLKDKGIARSKREAEELIADVLSLRRIDLYLQFERPLEEEELQKCREALKRRGSREPTQYICGKVSFAGLGLTVNKSVLIPRQETEILVEKISNQLRDLPLEGKILLDLCAGSGCIGLALKKRFPLLTVYLSDLSQEALEIAGENAKNNGCDVHLLQGDLFNPFKGKTCDFFVCNPPYVSEKEFVELEPEVRQFEPKVALVGGETGLEFYQRIALELPSYLNSPGRVWMELGRNQGENVKSLFKNSIWTSLQVEPDWSGVDRFFSLERHSFFR